MRQQMQLPDVDHISDPGFRALTMTLLEVTRSASEIGSVMLAPNPLSNPFANQVATDLERAAHRLRNGNLETWIEPDRRPKPVELPKSAPQPAETALASEPPANQPTRLIARFPGLLRAALEIAYDNGGINRERSEDDLKAKLESWIAQVQKIEHSALQNMVAAALSQISDWLITRTDDQMATICSGEEQEMAAALVGSPEGTSGILNLLFEEVC